MRAPGFFVAGRWEIADGRWGLFVNVNVNVKVDEEVVDGGGRERLKFEKRKAKSGMQKKLCDLGGKLTWSTAEAQRTRRAGGRIKMKIKEARSLDVR